MELKEYLAQKEFYSQPGLRDANLTKIFYLVEKAVKTQKPKLLDYEHIISIGAPNKGAVIDEDKYNSLLHKVYDIWYNNWLIPKKDQCSEWQRESIQNFLSDEYYLPNNVPNDDIKMVLFDAENKIHNVFAWYFQGEYFCRLDVNNFSLERNKKYDNAFCRARLYLNIKLENTPQLAEKLIDEAMKSDVPLHFKFALYDGRNDGFVFYTYFQYINQVADLIDRVKKENPELFVNCKVKNPLMATYRGYMGFGAEPYTFESYNSARVEILEKMYKELSQQFLANNDFLTTENIKKCFDAICKQVGIDCEHFCRNIERDWEIRDLEREIELLNN